ncbi:MAG: hypothetical protein OGM09_13765 [Fusobacterium varium]|uniref:hypothetical protein n=1 Tax=Fusobacterium varium TaxID=856 RepID=UPI00242ACA83|nr:hypothetical protein [Fusobacterium varium]UYI78211.1 MAG: hypothetical protein OGM09_13765 [Fusobacterium varium]
MQAKKYFKVIILLTVSFLILIAGSVLLIDPYFHYHKPLKFLSYYLGEQRYINDGIGRYFEYDSIITGTSMVENFKSSLFDNLFNSNSIKIPFFGGSYKEINDNLERTLKRKKDIKYVLRGLDYNQIIQNDERVNYILPTYLYDEDPLNDYKYLFNKVVVIKGLGGVITYTLLGKNTTTFDEYSSWNNRAISGKENILINYKRNKRENIKEEKLEKKDIEIIDKNIEKNVISLIKKYPNTKFIYFITPYSIVYWDQLKQEGKIEKQIMAEKYMIEKILEYSNVELYSFFNNYEMICDLDNYKDPGHYMGKINDKILYWISKKEYQLTKENYEEYIRKNLEFYKNYNYDSIFE